MAANSESREFENLRSALLEFPPTKDDESVRREIEGVVDRLAEVMGDVVSAHIPPKESHIGVTFRNLPGQYGAYVKTGYVDHLEQLNSVVRAYEDKRYWRTFLKSAKSASAKLPETPVKDSPCPTCGILFSKYKPCFCPPSDD